MGNDHYFTATPESVQKTTELRLTLRGHSVVMNSASGTFSPGSLDKGTAVLINKAGGDHWLPRWLSSHQQPRSGELMSMSAL
jgi:16S rRNA G1207 methylase RsmC